MKYKYKASIIIPTFNRFKLLCMTLDSLSNQSVDKNDYEVIIIDDGSTDATKDILKLYSNKLNLKYFFQENLGYRAAATRNKGIKMSASEICIFIDSGILLASKAIEEHLKYHEKFGICAVIGYVYGYDEYNENREKLLILQIDPHKIDEYIPLIIKNNILDLREKIFREIGYDMQNWPAPWVIFWSCNISIKHEILVKIGMFDEAYNTWGGEDTDLGIALHVNKIPIRFNPKIETVHFPHDKFKPSITDIELKRRTLNKKKYMYRKFGLPEIKTWFDIDTMNLNRYLLNDKR
ncbi:MAG: glycosyltransferase [Actinobacteria bacterium]|nr:glycosyltransferase [Actinomycetota bacterium]